MFADTLALVLSTGTVTVTKIKEENYTSEYKFSDTLHDVRVFIRHTKTKKTAVRPVYDRHSLEISETVFAAGAVAEFTRKDYVVIERLPSDVSIVNTDGLADLLIVSANANLVKLINGES